MCVCRADRTECLREQRELVGAAAAREWTQVRALLVRTRECQRALAAATARQRALDARVADVAAGVAAALAPDDGAPAAALASAQAQVDALADTLALVRADVARTRRAGWPVLPDDALLAPHVRADTLRHRLKDAKDLQVDISELL